ncbi:MAG: transposase, partial [Acidimicrobiales bacterium]|nr:transposase [Acidimicrobiales bacterium]
MSASSIPWPWPIGIGRWWSRAEPFGPRSSCTWLTPRTASAVSRQSGLRSGPARANHDRGARCAGVAWRPASDDTRLATAGSSRQGSTVPPGWPRRSWSMRLGPKRWPSGTHAGSKTATPVRSTIAAPIAGRSPSPLHTLGDRLEERGVRVVLLDERGTSSVCPLCGSRAIKAGRLLKCTNPPCGKVHHRDV